MLNRRPDQTNANALTPVAVGSFELLKVLESLRLHFHREDRTEGEWESMWRDYLVALNGYSPETVRAAVAAGIRSWKFFRKGAEIIEVIEGLPRRPSPPKPHWSQTKRTRRLTEAEIALDVELYEKLLLRAKNGSTVAAGLVGFAETFIK